MRSSTGIEELEPARLEITRMKRRHLKRVMAIEREAYPRPWSPNLFISEMSDEHTRAYLVAKLGREVIGYAGIVSYGEEAHITTIAVDPRQHRMKVGSRLMYELFQYAIRMEANAVSLEVRVSNWGAQRLYERFGFRPVGVRKNYYQEIGEDALIMWVDDVQTAEYGHRLDQIVEAMPAGVRPPG